MTGRLSPTHYYTYDDPTHALTIALQFRCLFAVYDLDLGN